MRDPPQKWFDTSRKGESLSHVSLWLLFHPGNVEIYPYLHALTIQQDAWGVVDSDGLRSLDLLLLEDRSTLRLSQLSHRCGGVCFGKGWSKWHVAAVTCSCGMWLGFRWPDFWRLCIVRIIHIYIYINIYKYISIHIYSAIEVVLVDLAQWSGPFP